MTFASPKWAYLLFMLPFLALLKITADAHAQRVVRLFVSSDRLRPLLLGSSPLWWLSLHYGLQLLGLGFFIMALTQPQLGTEESDIPQDGRDVYIAIDCSKSMLCDDMTPNRLTRAKLAAQDLLDKLPGDRVGLVAFAGRAFLQAPLTTDHDALREAIQSLDYTTIPRGGTSLASAIELVLDNVEKLPGQHHGMIMFSDGQETDDRTLVAAKEAAAKHLLILPVGLGTHEGSLIPDPDPEHRGDYLRDERGNVVKTQLEGDLLQKVATITGGEYRELASQSLSQGIVDGLMVQLDRQSTDSRHESRPIERYQWPLCAGLVCCILSLLMRPTSRQSFKGPALPVDPQATVHASPRPAVVASLLLLLAVAPLHAANYSYDAVKQAEEDYKKGQLDQARATYKQMLDEKEPPFDRADLSYGLGAAQRGLKDYDGAVHAFSDALRSPNKDLQEHALRGLASSLYDLGEERLQREPDFAVQAWSDSVDHFDSALQMLKRDSGEYKEMKENRDFVWDRLNNLKKKQEQQQQQGQGKKKKQKQAGNGSGDDDDEDSESDGNGQQKKQPKDNEGKENKKKHDALQKEEQEKIPQGEIHAQEIPGQEKKLTPAKPDDGPGKGKNFTEEEARNQLRNYADDQKTDDQRSLQYLMRRGERPVGGKDY